ncbi:hypothetical protein F4774DRAFT_418341 [Daldinia eschscholtzii]|nr:hypothetical protein F4774DRAFT_418341 [Daldinia eschscholtzii]
MDPSLKPKQSTELPIMPEAVVRLVQMLDSGKTYDSIYRALMGSDMVDAIADKTYFNGDEMRFLLHSLSPKLLRSVLMKTLGPDLYDPDFSTKANEENTFKSNGPGAYIVFIAIEGRKGKFLCARELRELIGLLRQYASAADAYQSWKSDDAYGSSQLTDEEDAIIQAMEIDDVLRSTDVYDFDHLDLQTFDPRWISQSKKKQMLDGKDVRIADPVLDLIAMLKKRLLPGVDQEVYQMQSPLLVGNAGHITKRAEHHIPSPWLGASTPNLWGLLLSCIHVTGLKPLVRYATLFRAWEDKEQVNIAETLGTVLAGSMITVDGCNVKQPGTRGADTVPESDFETSKKYIFAGKPWFRENLRRSRDQLPNSPTTRLRESVAQARENQKEIETLRMEKKDAKATLLQKKARHDRVYAKAEYNLQGSRAILEDQVQFLAAVGDILPDSPCPTRLTNQLAIRGRSSSGSLGSIEL